jgi:hypothetical protein
MKNNCRVADCGRLWTYAIQIFGYSWGSFDVLTFFLSALLMVKVENDQVMLSLR